MNSRRRIEQLLKVTSSGGRIARTLRDEGHSADDTEKVLLENSFSVQRETQPWGVILHISPKPVRAALEVSGALMGGSIEIAWHARVAKI